MSKKTKPSIEFKDDYTYFVVSPQAKNLTIQKFHLCSWRYRKPLLWRRKEILEIGLQVKISDPEALEKDGEGNRKLMVSVAIPWIQPSCNADDLYESIRNTQNTRFIFNEDVSPGDTFDGGDGRNGQILKFLASGDQMCFLPVLPEADEGFLRLPILIPPKVDLATMPIYVRVAVSMPTSRFCFAKNGFAKSLYSFDVKINEPRNLPSKGVSYPMCEIQSYYCLHIVPSHYQISFVDDGVFQHVRMLEHKRYNAYVEGRLLFKENVGKDDYQVVFNKRSDGKSNFYIVFESEHIGMMPIIIAAVINIICSVLFLFWQPLKDRCLANETDAGVKGPEIQDPGKQG